MLKIEIADFASLDWNINGLVAACNVDGKAGEYETVEVEVKVFSSSPFQLTLQLAIAMTSPCHLVQRARKAACFRSNCVVHWMSILRSRT